MTTTGRVMLLVVDFIRNTHTHCGQNTGFCHVTVAFVFGRDDQLQLIHYIVLLSFQTSSSRRSASQSKAAGASAADGAT